MTVQNHKYNFSIKREKRKLACFSEREKNRPKVNGKEFDGMHGLNTYDYGARQYNPITARWDRVDPLAEKYYPYSPYMYCLVNPMNAIDPDGREIWIHYVDEEGISQSFQYSAGMTCMVDNSTVKTLVSNLNEMHSNQDGATVLDAIIGSKTKYGIRQTNTHAEEGEGYFDPSTNTMSIYDANNTLTFAEETFHLYQYVNNQGGKTSVNEVDAKLFSAKMNFEIDEWFMANNGSYAKKIAGMGDTSYPDNMSQLLFDGYEEGLYKSAVDNFLDGSLGGSIYKMNDYTRGKIMPNPLIKEFLPAK